MTRYTVILVAILGMALSACSKKAPVDAILGSWTIDTDAMKQTEEFKKMPEAQRKMAEGMISAMKMSVEITKDTMKMSMSMMRKEKTDSLKYKVLKAEGDVISVETTNGKGKKESGTLTIKGGKLHMKKGKQTMVLKRG